MIQATIIEKALDSKEESAKYFAYKTLELLKIVDSLVFNSSGQVGLQLI
jgi:hypothetical protein